MVYDKIIYTFNSKCQKSSKSQASFFILKVSIMILNVTKSKRALGCSPENVCSLGQGKASTSAPNSYDNGSDCTFN